MDNADMPRLIYPSYSFKITENMYSVHLWQEIWRRHTLKERPLVRMLKKFLGKPVLDKNMICDRRSLYGSLQNTIRSEEGLWE